jgi:hypothetical protein
MTRFTALGTAALCAAGVAALGGCATGGRAHAPPPAPSAVVVAPAGSSPAGPPRAVPAGSGCRWCAGDDPSRRQYFDQRRKRYYYFDRARKAYFWENGEPKV